jgi:hypothetical protein
MDAATACYYTFSTVCQMLAGAFGFLVAVVLYRMQSFESQLHTLFRAKIEGNTYIAGRLSSDHREGNWLRIADELRKIVLDLDPKWEQSRRERQASEINQYLGVADRLLATKTGLGRALLATGLTIGGSLVLLPFTPLVAYSCLVAGLLMGAAVASAVYCLFLYFRLAKGVAE